MFITGTCPEWFWLIPLFGMVLMIGLMFFMCGKGMRKGVTGLCGCGRTDKHYNQERMADDHPHPADTNKE